MLKPIFILVASFGLANLSQAGVESVQCHVQVSDLIRHEYRWKNGELHLAEYEFRGQDSEERVSQDYRLAAALIGIDHPGEQATESKSGETVLLIKGWNQESGAAALQLMGPQVPAAYAKAESAFCLVDQ